MANGQSLDPEEITQKTLTLERLKGEPLPRFEVTDLQGQKLDSQAMVGKVLVLNFWFIGCKPCTEEMPELNKIVAEQSSDEVVFLAFGLDSSHRIEGFLEGHPFHYRLIPNSRDYASQTLGVVMYPTHVVVDKRGIVQYVHVGYGTGAMAKLKRALKKALK